MAYLKITCGTPAYHGTLVEYLSALAKEPSGWPGLLMSSFSSTVCLGTTLALTQCATRCKRLKITALTSPPTPTLLTPYLGCFLSKLQAGEKVAVGTKQEDLLEDTFLHLGNHQPHQHVQGGSAHVQTGGVGEILLQVVEGPWKRAEEPP